MCKRFVLDADGRPLQLNDRPPDCERCQQAHYPRWTDKNAYTFKRFLAVCELGLRPPGCDDPEFIDDCLALYEVKREWETNRERAKHGG